MVFLRDRDLADTRVIGHDLLLARGDADANVIPPASRPSRLCHRDGAEAPWYERLLRGAGLSYRMTTKEAEKGTIHLPNEACGGCYRSKAITPSGPTKWAVTYVHVD
jgi:hypothetical protein